MSYQRITLEEREEIFRLRYIERQTLTEIGQRLGKDKSSVSREIKRGTKNRLYNPLAGEAARIDGRKRQCPPQAENVFLPSSFAIGKGGL
ncbi:MAG: helix-turn-helix domain-containing protein [Treponema sp.]|jgi:IS30 family transposase|nr:helix-turn-helix domain-containing protein [Treponema sp.]